MVIPGVTMDNTLVGATRAELYCHLILQVLVGPASRLMLAKMARKLQLSQKRSSI